MSYVASFQEALAVAMVQVAAVLMVHLAEAEVSPLDKLLAALWMFFNVNKLYDYCLHCKGWDGK